MPTAAFANLGCKVNQYEIEKIAESFACQGFDLVAFDQPADVYVINTCSVTAAADRKSRHMARKAARQQPGAKVVLTGCFAQLALDTGEAVDGAALLVPNRDKMRVAQHTLNAFPDLIRYSGSPASAASLSAIGAEPPRDSYSRPLPVAIDGAFSGTVGISANNSASSIAVFPEQAGLIDSASLVGDSNNLSRTRGTLKVQDGCVHFCAFCSIPYTRSTMASRSLAAIIDEARNLAESGITELVVTGVCVGAYEDNGHDLADLLLAVADVDGIDRVRLSSIQPIETTDRLIDAIASHRSICPHLHLSLQSGDDSVLAAMQRPYDTAYYRNLVQKLRARMPQIAITTDIIVGFPGESSELFANTLAFAQEMAFARAHIFKYSPRSRTYAATNLRDDVSDADKDARHKELSAVCSASQSGFAKRLIGTSTQVLVEARGRQTGWMAGYTANYVRVHFPGGPELRGSSVRVHIQEVGDGGEAVGTAVAGPGNGRAGGHSEPADPSIMRTDQKERLPSPALPEKGTARD